MRSIINIIQDCRKTARFKVEEISTYIADISPEFHMNEIDFYPEHIQIGILYNLANYSMDSHLRLPDNVNPIIMKYVNLMRVSRGGKNRCVDLSGYSNYISDFKILLHEL